MPANQCFENGHCFQPCILGGKPVEKPVVLAGFHEKEWLSEFDHGYCAVNLSR